MVAVVPGVMWKIERSAMTSRYENQEMFYFRLFGARHSGCTELTRLCQLVRGTIPGGVYTDPV
jgi:hypothetical protein